VPEISFIVGLTGGIGSGKSTVAELFAHLGVEIIDADAIAHAVTRPLGAAIVSLSSAFGPEILDASGALDRARMRALIFDDLVSKSKLEAILHPIIRAQMDAAVDIARGKASPYIMLAVPLMFETMSYQDRVQRTLAVDCTVAQQVQRVRARSAIDAVEVGKIIASQVERSIRLQMADDVISNSGSGEGLLPQVAALHKGYLARVANAGEMDE